jgi:hypothetical protein
MSKASDQTPNIPQHIENNVLPHMQRINQRMRQTFSNSTRSLSEENEFQNSMPRNNNEDESDDINVPNNPPPVWEANISSYNAQGNTIKNSLNNKSFVGPSGSTRRT